MESRLIVRRAKARALAALGLTLTLAAILPGCGSMISGLPSPIGLSEGLPARPDVLPVTPAVHDMPPPREQKLLTKEELNKLEGDLKDLQEGQTRRTGANPPQKSGVKTAKPAASKPGAKAKSGAHEKQSSN